MGNLIATKELAKKYLDIALKCNNFKRFFVGSPLYELTVKDSYGNDVFSSMHVMEAIYDKYREDPSCNIDKMTYETIINELRNSRYGEQILKIFENIIYQISAQKNKTAPFNFDCVELLEEMKMNLSRNEDFYKSPDVNLKPHGIWPEVEMYDARIQKIIGRKIL